eukprot:scaffold73323_cov31-Tisochrysis_lutea.AAC.1
MRSMISKSSGSAFRFLVLGSWRFICIYVYVARAGNRADDQERARIARPGSVRSSAALRSPARGLRWRMLDVISARACCVKALCFAKRCQL